MKRLITIVFCIYAISSHAEGYQVNTQSARQLGMGHTGTGLGLGAESMHFNPAGLSSMKGAFDFSAGFAAVASKVKYSGESGDASTDNGVSTPIFLYGGFKVLGDRLAAGVSVTTPYGSGIDWGRNWAGCTAIQDISLRSFVIQPTVSVKLFKGLSFGAGLMIGTGSFDLSKSLSPRLPLGDGGALVSPAWMSLAGSSDVCYGYNVGLLYEFCDRLSLGVSYRSKLTAEVSSKDTHIGYYNAAMAAAFASAGVYEGQEFTTELPMPSNLNVGVGFVPCEKLLLAFDLQFVGWSAYKDLTFDFPAIGQTSTSPKNYHNTVIVRLGGEYSVSQKVILRAGVYYDQTPVDNTHLYPDGPGADKFGYTLGAGLKLFKGFSIDAAVNYIDGSTHTGSCPAPTALTPTARFAGSYTPSAWTASLGLGYSF